MVRWLDIMALKHSSPLSSPSLKVNDPKRLEHANQRLGIGALLKLCKDQTQCGGIQIRLVIKESKKERLYLVIVEAAQDGPDSVRQGWRGNSMDSRCKAL